MRIALKKAETNQHNVLGKAVNKPETYRQISLLSVTHKLLEKLILNRVNPPLSYNIPIDRDFHQDLVQQMKS